MMDHFLACFQAIEQSQSSALAKQGLGLKAMMHKGAASLYISCDQWSNRLALAPGEQSAGVFFSVWVNADPHQQDIFHYTAHALKLRTLPGYHLSSIKFAEIFRERALSQLKDWPSVNLEHGPLTLFDGVEPLEEASFDADVIHRITQFASLQSTVDQTFAQFADKAA